MNFLKKLILCAAAVAAFPIFAQIDIAVEGIKGNDTLLFRGYDGPANVQKQVAHDLLCCGWFDIVKSGAATYLVTGKSDGDRIILNISDAAGAPVTTVVGYGRTTEEASRKAVDAALRALYKVDGICSSRIAFSVETGRTIKEIYTCAYDGSDFQRITSNGGLSLNPVWSPGNRSIIYSFTGGSYTALIEYDLMTKRSRRLASFKGVNAGGRISPDGRKIALVLSKDNQVDLYVREVNGKTLRRLTNDRAVEASPCWSPDGTQICYVTNAGTGRPRLRVISANGGIPRTIPGTLGSESVSPCWGKDGKIIYTSRMGNYTISVLDPEGTAQKKSPSQMVGVIIKKGGDWESPSWAPDNRHAVCTWNGALFIVDTWSGKTRKIVGGRSKISLPAWSALNR